MKRNVIGKYQYLIGKIRLRKSCSGRLRFLPAAAALTVSLSACAGDAPEQSNLPDVQTGIVSEETDSEEDAARGTAEGGANGEESSGSGLRLLYELGKEGCNTREGYYYLTKELEKLADGNYGIHLMYMDFTTQQEIYLCSNAGCSHNTADCPAVFLYEDFPPYTSPLFVHGDGLYILSKEMDSDGGMSTSVSYFGDAEGLMPGNADIGENSTILYRMNLDGTQREKIHTFDPSLTLEDYVMADENGIYVIAKKLSTERDGQDAYVTSSQRRLLYLDLGTGEEREVCGLDLGGNISWQLAGCYGRSLVMEGTDYGREISREEMLDDNVWRDLYLNSEEIFAVFDLDSRQLTEKYRMPNRNDSSALAEGNQLYISDEGEGVLKAVDLRDGSERILCRQENDFFRIWYIIGDKLCCKNKDTDATFYYVDIHTGEISHSALVNKSLGWSLEFRAVLDSEVLVIYDYEALPSELNEDAYDILQYKYALISKEDLFSGNANYRPIQMTGNGM